MAASLVYEVIKVSVADREPIKELLRSEPGWILLNEYVDFTITAEGGMYAARDETGKILGICCVVRHGHQAGFMYGFLVRSGYRRRGIGRELFSQCVQSCNPAGCIGVSAEQEKLASIYSKWGFLNRDFGAMDMFGKIKPNIDVSIAPSEKITVMQLQHVEYSKVFSFDDETYPFQRHEFLAKFFNRPNMVTLVAKEGDSVVGFGCVWSTGNGYRIMPLYARSATVARQLLLDLLKHMPKERVVNLSVPSCNKEALAMISGILDYTEEPVEIIRAYKDIPPKIDTSCIFSTINGMGPC